MQTILSYQVRLLIAVLAVGTCLLPARADAHCDTLDGPVAEAARKALASANPAPVLMWVGKQEEPEVRRVFEHTVAVRKLGAEAARLADRFFMETVVRLHRAGEGEPYTGLKPAGTDVGPAVRAADKAIDEGSAQGVMALLTNAVRAGVDERFHGAKDARVLSGTDVEAGRAYVARYVSFVHYVERLYDAATSAAHAHGHAGTADTPAAAPAHDH